VAVKIEDRSGVSIQDIAAFCLVVAAIKLSAPFLVPVTLAAVLVTVTSPLSTWLVQKRVPPAIAVVVGGLATLLAIFAATAALGLASTQLNDEWPHYSAQGAAFWSSARHWLGTHGVQLSATGPKGPDWVGMATNLLQRAASLLSDFFVVMLVVFFGLAEVLDLGGKLRKVTDDPELGFSKVDEVVRKVQTYLLVKTFTSLLVAALTYVVLKVADVKLALLLSVLLFLLHFVPNVGAVLATIPAVIAAFLDSGPGAALGVLVSMSITNFVVGNVIEPRLLGRTLGLSSFAVVVSLLFWGWLWGPAGAILSVPIVMVLKITLERTKYRRWAYLLEPAPHPEDEEHGEALPAPSAASAAKRLRLWTTATPAPNSVGLGARPTPAPPKPRSTPVSPEK
jgi:AI-2 transport protein TqsA